MTSPFDPGAVEEVSLPRAPLVRVLSQVRWPQLSIMKANLDAFAEQLGRSLSDVYPIIGDEREVQVTLTPDGVTQTPGGKLYHLDSADNKWRVTFGESFIALETKNYTSREDFCIRLEKLIAALREVVVIPHVVRLGFRYTNRIESTEEQYSRLADLIDFSVLGGAPVPLAGRAIRLHSLSEAIFQIDGVQLLTRSAHLPAGATIDTAINPARTPSWVLDLDAFQEERVDFEARSIAIKVGDLSETAYKFFRWVTNNEFLKSYGGDI